MLDEVLEDERLVEFNSSELERHAKTAWLFGPSAYPASAPVAPVPAALVGVPSVQSVHRHRLLQLNLLISLCVGLR